MSQAGTVALSVLIASFLVSLRIPANIRSWSDKARFRRSGAIIGLISLNCFRDDVMAGGLFDYLPYVTFVIAANLIVSHLKSIGSVWTGRRTLAVTRLITTVVACFIAWHGKSTPVVFVISTICAGLSHAFLARSESAEIIKNYRDLQNRLLSLESTQSGIQKEALPARSEARDKSREAG